MAAMGARPTGFLAALALPPDLEAQAAYDIMSGIDQCCEYCGTGIVGGDTKSGPGIVCGTALGTMDGRPPMLRSGARPGDIVAVTGPLGSPAAAFIAIENGVDAQEAKDSLYVPIPRVAEGSAMAGSGAVTSCMDLSDGLGTALNTLCEASGVGMDVELDFIPRGPWVDEMAELSGRPAKDLLLGWGGEYELVFTADRDRLERLYDAELEFSIIGMVNDSGAPCLIENGSRTVIPYGEYRARRVAPLRPRRGCVRLRAVPPPLQDQGGRLREVRLPQGRRGHARGVLLRQGLVPVRGPGREEAALPLPSGHEDALALHGRMLIRLRFLPEPCHRQG